jgi:hypothetical protein
LGYNAAETPFDVFQQTEDRQAWHPEGIANGFGRNLTGRAVAFECGAFLSLIANRGWSRQIQVRLLQDAHL